MKRLTLFICFALAASFFCCERLPAQTAPINPPAAAGQSQPAGSPLTRTQAEAIALKNNPQITIGKLIALQSWQSVREARSALLPNAFLSVTGVDSQAGSRIAAGALNNPVIFPRAAAGATVSQLVTDFGRTANVIGGANYEAKAQDQNAAATAADIIEAVDRAFYSALETKALVNVAQQTVNFRQTFVRQNSSAHQFQAEVRCRP